MFLHTVLSLHIHRRGQVMQAIRRQQVLVYFILAGNLTTNIKNMNLGVQGLVTSNEIHQQAESNPKDRIRLKSEKKVELGQGTLLLKQMANGAERFWSDDCVPEDVSLEGLPQVPPALRRPQKSPGAQSTDQNEDVWTVHVQHRKNSFA